MRSPIFFCLVLTDVEMKLMRKMSETSVEAATEPFRVPFLGAAFKNNKNKEELSV